MTGEKKAEASGVDVRRTLPCSFEERRQRILHGIGAAILQDAAFPKLGSVPAKTEKPAAGRRIRLVATDAGV